MNYTIVGGESVISAESIKEVSEEVSVSATDPFVPGMDIWIDTAATDAVFSAYTTAEADAKFVDVAGDTMTGSLVLAANPTVALGAAPKQYVDAMVTVSTADASGTPARDGLLWVKVV